MRTISVINLKGGVGKTVTSTNLAYQLARRGNNVLLIDCDKQGNSSKAFNAYEHEWTLADVLLGDCSITDAIQHVTESDIGRLDIISANMFLLAADRRILLDTTKPQQTRLSNALDSVERDYTYCIIDCAPDINISVINALVASDDVIIPVTIDRYAFDGISEILTQVDDVKKYYNPNIRFAGCLVTKYKNDDFTNDGIKALKQLFGTVFDSKIRNTDMVSKSTFAGETVIEYSPRCGASRSYAELAAEIERGQNNG